MPRLLGFTALAMVLSVVLGLHLSLQVSSSPLEDSVEMGLTSPIPLPWMEEEFSSLVDFSAASVLVKDLETQAILYAKDTDAELPIASLTKLMTAYLVFKSGDLNDLVSVSENAALTGGSSMGMTPGETFTIEELLYGLLVPSGNDAAVALAEYISGSEEAFVEEMNAMADALGMTDTHFANASGLDAEGAYSTSRDLSLLTIELLKNEVFRNIVKNERVVLKSEEGNLHVLENTNILLDSLGVIGVKTGTTAAAGECLITLTRNEEGHEILIIILGSSNRYIETEELIPWSFEAFHW